jgi:hypothetical protein
MTGLIDTVKGVLTQERGKTFLLKGDENPLLENELIWSGYVRHWLGKMVCARYLPQRDYEKGKPIIIMWPDDWETETPYMDLYFNERLPKYRASFFGHIAVNVNGKVFNFSHHMNENEVMTPEEYFYRPPLGEFAPHPKTGLYADGSGGRPYYDKFGRLFMRTVHVLRIEDLETERLLRFYYRELKKTKNGPIDPNRPDIYTGFNVLTRNCTTIIRDGLRKCGFRKVKGIVPKDFFVCATHCFRRLEEMGAVRTKTFKLGQLKVPEATYSVGVPLVNPINWIREVKSRMATKIG